MASTAETYGEERIVVPGSQLSAFSALLSESLEQGFTGLRMAADNSSLIAGADRLAAWLEWESVADRFMADGRVTGLCAFDRSRTAGDDLGRVLGAHQQLVAP